MASSKLLQLMEATLAVKGEFAEEEVLVQLEKQEEKEPPRLQL